MKKPLDRDAIAAAMRDVAWKALHGTREDRSGKFIATTTASETSAPPKKSAAARG